MKDRRTVDELSIEELEEILRILKREERVRRLRERDGGANSLDPLAPPKSSTPSTPAPPNKHRQFQELGATTQYRARAVPEAADEGREGARVQRRLRLRWDWLRDKGLLVAEVGVLVALVLVLVASLATLRQINRASRGVQALPTLTPTPPIHVVLPGGHTPPDSPEGPAPAEIPAHLQDLVDSVTPVAVPTPGPEHATRIQIPAIDVDAPVVEGDDWETLKRGAGHHVGSANPGERGNCVISAHNDIYGEIFRDLPELRLGDEVVVHTATRSYRYVITQKRVIEPTEVQVMEPTSSPVLTLLSCYPYGIDTHRIVVVGELTS
ncbi:MAG: class D sortase [Anaerolineae bacterium]